MRYNCAADRANSIDRVRRERESRERIRKAAPDLLAACKYTIERLKGVKGKTFPIMPILDAIAKAEG